MHFKWSFAYSDCKSRSKDITLQVTFKMCLGCHILDITYSLKNQLKIQLVCFKNSAPNSCIISKMC